MEKVQNLFLIIGTNPMPNVIAIDERAKKGGNVIFIGTKTLNVKSSNLSEIIKEAFKDEELNIEILIVDELDDKDVYKKVLEKAESLEGSIELNYTGGTKPMSSGAYDAFKKLKGKKYVSYVDTPREEIIIEYIDNENNERLYIEKSLEKNKFNKRYGLNMILKIHGIDGKKIDRENPLKEEAIELFQRFENGDLEKKKSIIKSLEEILKLFENYSKEELENKLKALYEKDTVEKIMRTLAEEYKDDLSKYKKYLIGENLEIYLDDILSRLKEQGVIDEYFWSYVEKNKEKQDKFEIDFIIKKGYKIGLVSVTMCDYKAAIINKGNEVKVRARQLAGDKTEALLIAFYENCEEIEAGLNKNINYNGKTKIIGLDKFYNIEEKLKAWVENNSIDKLEEKKETRGVCIVGGAVDGSYISIKGMLNEGIDRLMLIATRSDNKERGTIGSARNIKEVFKEKNIKIDILEIPKNSILEIEDVLKNKVLQENEVEKIIIDYTGGTKLHSCVIKNYIERESNSRGIEFEKRYIDYEDKSISIDNDRKVKYEEFEDRKEDLENLLKLKGYSLLKNNILINEKKDEKICFKKLELDKFTFKFTVNFKEYENKLKLLNIVSKFEGVGGKYCVINVEAKEEDLKKAKKVVNQFFGIKENDYKKRVLINGERLSESL